MLSVVGGVLRGMPLLLDSDTRVATLTRAIDLVLGESGATALTMRRIAAVSGVSTSSMLHHFGSRERMLLVCAHASTWSRATRLTDAVIDDGPLALLPRTDRDVAATRVGLGWLELWRCLPVLEEVVRKARWQELNVLGHALDDALTPAQLRGARALVDGLRVEVCSPVEPMAPDEAQQVLAERLGALVDRDIRLGRPLVASSSWRWPLVPGPRRVATTSVLDETA